MGAVATAGWGDTTRASVNKAVGWVIPEDSTIGLLGRNPALEG